jgi:low affinity Fe/Cu permease
MFDKIARKVSWFLGSAKGLLITASIILIWLICTVSFNLGETNERWGNLTLSIATFMGLFMLQYTQRVEMTAVHIKLDEIIKVTKAARNKIISIEDLSEKDLQELKDEFNKTIQ